MKAIGALTALLLVTSGCADSLVGGQVTADALDALEQRRETADVFGNYAETLGDYLPGQLISFDGKRPRALAAGVVHGTIREVDQHGAYVAADRSEGEEGPDGDEVAFTDPDAEWRMVAVTVDIDESWGRDLPPSGQLGFVLPADGDYEAFMRGIEGLGEVVVVLSASYALDSSLYRVAESDAAIGLVDDTGAIDFPALGDDGQAFLGDLTTVAAMPTGLT